MERQKKVLDASVLLKAFTHEQLSEKVLVILEEYEKGEIEIVVPELLFLEILNGLNYKKNIAEEKLLEVNKYLWNMGFKIDNINDSLLSKTISIAKENKLSIYDASYVALAQFHGCPLITADKGLYKISNVVPLEKT